MSYRYATERPDYADFAAGPVLYSMPGQPAFPVRLTTEVFQRCQTQLRRLGSPGPYRALDPCCGSAYLLTTLGFLHRGALRSLAGSDIEPEAVALAQRNLSLLTPDGAEARIAQLEAWHGAYGKPSHAEAAASARRLRERLRAEEGPPLATRAFVADALDGAALAGQLGAGGVDLVITDVPYGQRTAWRGAAAEDDAPEWRLLDALRAVLAPLSVVALTGPKQPRVAHESYERLEQLQVGRRRTLIFRLRTP